VGQEARLFPQMLPGIVRRPGSGPRSRFLLSDRSATVRVMKGYVLNAVEATVATDRTAGHEAERSGVIDATRINY
jgi:hypothetical protein